MKTITYNSCALDVVVVGNVGIDTSIYSHGDPDFTQESSFTENLDCVGQAGGYASLAFARLSRKTGFIGYIGDDFCGQQVREVFARGNIDTSCLFVDPAGTNRSINLMYADGRRKNFYDGKTHMSLKPDVEACRALLSRARLVHFNIPNWARILLPIASELGLVISCDLQDVPAWSDPYREDFIRYSDVLFFSAVQTKDVFARVREYLGTEQKRIVVAGLAARGCAVGSQMGIRVFESISSDDPVIDANGAGDCLAAAFLSSLIFDRYSLEDSIGRAQIAARYKCSRKGSSDLITSGTLDDSFNKGYPPAGSHK
jgi:acarbose 7IV-phosphotransferase